MGHMGIARLLIPLGILPEKLSTSISERVCHHTESMYKAGIVSFSMTRRGAKEAVYNEAKALAKARGDYMFEIVPE